jgi:hypothetical protein
MTVQAQKDRSTGDHCKLQGPCVVPVRINSPSDQRVDLRSAAFQDHDSEKGIQDVKPCNQKQAEEQILAVAVNITSSALILGTPERTPLAEYSIATQNWSGLLSTILRDSPVHRNTLIGYFLKKGKASLLMDAGSRNQ